MKYFGFELLEFRFRGFGFRFDISLLSLSAGVLTSARINAKFYYLACSARCTPYQPIFHYNSVVVARAKCIVTT